MTGDDFWKEVDKLWRSLSWMDWERMDLEEQDMYGDIASYLFERTDDSSIFVDNTYIDWAGTSRAKCGCCTRRIPSTNKCWENIRSPVFYNTPTFGCEKFEDNGEELR